MNKMAAFSHQHFVHVHHQIWRFRPFFSCQISLRAGGTCDYERALVSYVQNASVGHMIELWTLIVGVVVTTHLSKQCRRTKLNHGFLMFHNTHTITHQTPSTLADFCPTPTGPNTMIRTQLQRRAGERPPQMSCSDIVAQECVRALRYPEHLVRTRAYIGLTSTNSRIECIVIRRSQDTIIKYLLHSIQDKVTSQE